MLKINHDDNNSGNKSVSQQERNYPRPKKVSYRLKKGMDDASDFHKNLSKLMTEKGFTEYGLSMKAFGNKEYIRGIFRFGNIPTYPRIVKIAEALGVSVETVLYGEEKSEILADIENKLRQLSDDDLTFVSGVVDQYVARIQTRQAAPETQSADEKPKETSVEAPPE